MERNNISLIKMPLITFRVQIWSFNSQDICEAYDSTEYDHVLSPEEAQLAGINICEVKDIGVQMPITLGQELEDWRKFCECRPEDMKLLQQEYVLLELLSRSVWINPRIRNQLDQWRGRGIQVKDETSNFIAQPCQSGLVENFESNVPQYQPKLPVGPMMDQTGIVEDWEVCALFMFTKRGRERLCNFIPLPMNRVYEFDDHGNRGIHYNLAIFFYGHEKIIIKVNEADLSALYQKVVVAVDSAVLYAYKGNKQLEEYVRGKLPFMKEKDVTFLVKPGWQRVSGTAMYGLDGRAINNANVSFYTGRRLCVTPIDATKSWEYFVDMLNVSQDKKITAVMMLYSFLGLTYQLFEEAEYRLQFLLYVVGTTGSLKTSLAKALFNVFNTDRPQEQRMHTFSDTQTAVEQYVGSLKDEVGLLDDLELGDSDNEARRQKEIYNEVVRMVGDSKGKNRSNPGLEDVKAKVARGLVVITGEQVLGKQSTRLRFVELEVTKGSIQGDRLSVFQSNPHLWSTLCWYYILYLEEHYNEIVNFINKQSVLLRREFQIKFKHLRTVDQLVAFYIISSILEKFWLSKVPNINLVQNTMREITQMVEKVLFNTTISDEVENPAIRFILDLDAMIGRGEVKLAQNAKEFEQLQGYIGYWERGDILLIRDLAYERVLDYESRMRRRFAFDLPKILKSLYEQEEVLYKFPNGRSDTYVIKKNRQIFIKLNGEKFNKIVSSMEGGE